MLCSPRMLANFLGEIWRRLPVAVRRRAAKIGQARFTVTVAAMLFDDQGRLLLLEHVFRADRGWGVPGGFVSKGEHPEEALRRELREEASIEIADVKFLFTRNLRKLKQVEFYFRARAIGNPTASSFEIKQAQVLALFPVPVGLLPDVNRRPVRNDVRPLQ